MKKKLMGVLLVVSMIVSSSTNAFAIAIESGTDGIRILEEKKQGNIGLSNVVTDYRSISRARHRLFRRKHFVFSSFYGLMPIEIHAWVE